MKCRGRGGRGSIASSRVLSGSARCDAGRGPLVLCRSEDFMSNGGKHVPVHPVIQYGLYDAHY
jgi:hypothetical protein